MYNPEMESKHNGQVLHFQHYRHQAVFVEHWSRWFEVLKQTAEGQNIWHKVDPDMATEEGDLLQEPEMLGTETLEQYIEDRTTDEHTPTMLEAIQYYHVVHMEACRKHKYQETKELAIHKWIALTVNPSLHSSVHFGIHPRGDRPQTRLMVLTAETATQYKELLNDARWANTSPDKWIEKWNTIYQKAARQNINEIKGPNAIQDFIQAVGAQFEPTWAEAKKVKMVEYNNDLPDHITLKSVAEEFMRYRKATRVFSQDNGKQVHATLGNQSDKNNSNKGQQKTTNCPCGFIHKWEPQLCRTLRYAITGELINKKRTPSKDLCEKIKARYELPHTVHVVTLNINNNG
ncbi:hypothetical protein E4U40_001332 [Claviceps sp. LM458 group G5]|nr:hypothetical protein E4U40_001332 [Claviceps sp. LM458 group G5]